MIARPVLMLLPHRPQSAAVKHTGKRRVPIEKQVLGYRSQFLA
jgi:hypothetical protein